MPTLLRFFDSSFPSVDDRDHMAHLFEIFEAQPAQNFGVDLKDVAIMKVVCDTFFLREIRPAGLEYRANQYHGRKNSSVRGHSRLERAAIHELKRKDAE